MKQLLLLLSVGCMLSCTDTIDKKLSRDSFNEDVKEIKTKYATEYSEADFVEFRETASNKLTADLLGSGDAKNLTYRAVLDTVKAHRIRDEKEVAEYNRLRDELAKNMEVTVLDCLVRTQQYLDYMSLQVTAKNNFSQAVKAFEGEISVYNLLDRQVDKYFVERTDSMPPGFTGIFIDHYITDKFSNKEDADFKKLKFKWEPWKVVLADGSVIERPEKPRALIMADL